MPCPLLWDCVSPVAHPSAAVCYPLARLLGPLPAFWVALWPLGLAMQVPPLVVGSAQSPSLFLSCCGSRADPGQWECEGCRRLGDRASAARPQAPPGQRVARPGSTCFRSQSLIVLMVGWGTVTASADPMWVSSPAREAPLGRVGETGSVWPPPLPAAHPDQVTGSREPPGPPACLFLVYTAVDCLPDRVHPVPGAAPGCLVNGWVVRLPSCPQHYGRGCSSAGCCTYTEGQRAGDREPGCASWAVGRLTHTWPVWCLPLSTVLSVL